MRGTAGDNNILLNVDDDNKYAVHLHQVLDTLLTRVQEQCGELLQTTMAPQSGLQTFDFLGNSILAAVDQQVASSLPGTLPMPAAQFIDLWQVSISLLGDQQVVSNLSATLPMFAAQLVDL